MNNSNTLIASLVIAAAGSAAAAGSLEMDRAYASELKADADARSVLNQGNQSNLEVSVGVIFGYKMNHRDGAILGDDDTAIGFAFSEVEVAVEGDVTNNMHARISFDFGPSDTNLSGSAGSAFLEDAFVDWQVNDSLTLRVGQFIPAFSAEASTSEFNTQNAYRSVSHLYLADTSWTQGIQATFGGDTWKMSLGFNDGIDTNSTAFNRGIEADFALNARFDLFSDSDHARFDDQTSWRGAENGWRVGAGVFFASYGDTNPTPSEDENLFYTIDGAFEGDGWAVRAAFYGTDIDPGSSASRQNHGVEVGGSVFLSDQWEAFGRWDMLILDDAQTTGDNEFNFVALGANYYFVPESHAAKLSFEIAVSLDETFDIVASSGDAGAGTFGLPGVSGFYQDQPGESGQLMLSAMMQWLF